MKAITRLAAIGLAVAALCVPAAAVADSGHGHGNGGGQSQGYSQQQQQQGYSSQPQQQQGYSSAPQSQQGYSGHGDKHGDQGGGSQSKQSSSSPSNPQTGGSNSQGVKPSNDTKHDTYAKASSDKTKRYGNGQTAGQIATKYGHGNDTLHGPGNSQPHKTTSCKHSHEVDVHALKHGDAGCGQESGGQSSGGSCGCTSGGSSQGVSGEKKTGHEKARESEHKQPKDENKQPKSSGGSCACTSGGSSQGVSGEKKTGHEKKARESEHKQPKSEQPQPQPQHPSAASTGGEIGYCHQVNGQWVYGTATAEELAKLVASENVIAPSFEYRGHEYSENWNENGKSIYEKCKHGEKVEAGGSAQGGVAGETASDHEKVTICHATGSMTNPYVEITISKEGWLNGHSKHADDLYPVPAGGCPQPVQAPAPAPAPSTGGTSAGTDCGTATVSMGPVGVWHHTGSKKNPYVFIRPSQNSAHYSKHTDDIVVMGPVASSTGDTSDCVAPPAPTPAPSVGGQECGTQTTTTQVLVPIGVWHHTGSKKNPYVFITPSTNSAHYSKHDDDIIVWGVASTSTSSNGQDCTTVTPVPVSPSTPPATPGTTSPSPVDTTTTETTTTQQGTGVAGTTTTTTEVSGATETTPSSSGVAGASTTKTTTTAASQGVNGVRASGTTPRASHHGVLGAIAHGTLPYTGFPLWLAVLIAVAVILVGIALTRTRRNPADPTV